MTDFPDLITLLVILCIVFGATVMPRLGEYIGRRIARSKAKRSDQPSPKPEEPSRS